MCGIYMTSILILKMAFEPVYKNDHIYIYIYIRNIGSCMFFHLFKLFLLTWQNRCQRYYCRTIFLTITVARKNNTWKRKP